MSAAHGVRVAGVGSATPDKILTNHDLAKMMDTSDEWIVQRTGVHRRHIVDESKGESQITLATQALRRALDDANMVGSDLDLLIHASVTSEMACPSNACRIADAVGAAPAGAFDILAACSGFVYALNVAEAMIRSGRYGTIGIIGCDALSQVVDYTERSVSILFGDAGGSAILTRDDDPERGCLYQMLEADGKMWSQLYMPRRPQEIPAGDEDNPIRLGCLRMKGREVYKFAVIKFCDVIKQTLDESGLCASEISHFICHQSNRRIIESAKEKLGLPDAKVPINIHEYGNTSSGSVGLLFDQVWQSGRIKRGDLVLFSAFGGGMTWATSVWRM